MFKITIIRHVFNAHVQLRTGIRYTCIRVYEAKVRGALVYLVLEGHAGNHDVTVIR